MKASTLPSWRGRLTINHGAVADNYRAMARLSGDCGAVIKANAYGMGATPLAACLTKAGCRHFFVADASEGIALRAGQPDAEIYLLDGLTEADLGSIIDARLRPVLTSPQQDQRWRSAGQRAAVWQIDSGMNRLGFSLAQASALAAQVGPPDLIVSHLACADETHRPDHRQQIRELAKIRQAFAAVPLSLGNTAGIQLGADGQSTLSRCGIGLYGVNPAQSPQVTLTSALALEGRVLQCRRVPAGSPVGYGASWHAGAASTLLTVGLGYADGIHRSLSNTAVVNIQGHALPFVGRISMDYLVLDASALEVVDQPQALSALEWVSLFDSAASLQAMAEAAGTISYELLTHLGPRIERCHVN